LPRRILSNPSNSSKFYTDHSHDFTVGL
jgi:hypothetical protein